MDVSAILFSVTFFAAGLSYWLCKHFIIMDDAKEKKGIKVYFYYHKNSVF
jgi:hypothetical protein